MVARASRTLVVAATAAGIALLAVVGVGHAGPIDELVVTNSNFPLQGSINVFAPGGGKNAKPTTVISGGQLVPGFSSTSLLGGVDISPVSGGVYVVQDLSLLARGVLPDFVEIFAPNATGASGPIGAIGTSKTVPLDLPQDIAFVDVAGAALGEFYVSNLTGGSNPEAPLGSVILFPANAGTPDNPLGVPIGIVQNAADCVGSLIALPVGVATNSTGNLYVASQGVPGLIPSQVSIYPAGATGCVAPIGVVGIGTLTQAEFVAVDGAGNIWVSDLAKNAIFEFDPAGGPEGAPITSIIGKKPHLRSPMGIALSPSAAPADTLYVANNGLGEIDLFENVDDGGLLNIRRTVALKGKKTKLNLPVGVATPPVVPD
jgi:hypothetical protein